MWSLPDPIHLLRTSFLARMSHWLPELRSEVNIPKILWTYLMDGLLQRSSIDWMNSCLNYRRNLKCCFQVNVLHWLQFLWSPPQSRQFVIYHYDWIRQANRKAATDSVYNFPFLFLVQHNSFYVEFGAVIPASGGKWSLESSPGDSYL